MEATQFQSLVTTALLVHENTINEVKQSIDVDILLVDEKLKWEAYEAWWAEESVDKRLDFMRILADRLVQDEVPGGKRLQAETDKHLQDSILRLRTKHWEPKEGTPWKFTLTPSLSQTECFRGALSDLIASGGNDRIMIRRPLLHVGTSVAQLAESV